MPYHSYLYGILVSLTSSVNYITTHAPSPNGYLKRELRYVFNFKDFEEMRRQNMCIPDGLILNEDKGLLIVPECKSGPDERADAEPRIQHQILTYSSPQFHETLSGLIDYDDFEIVVFTFPTSVAPLIQQLPRVDANIVMWSLEDYPSGDMVSIRKVYGEHLDPELDQTLSLGVHCEPPAREFIDPDMLEPRIAFVLGCRLLNSYGELLLRRSDVIVPSEFRKGNLDLVFSEARLKHFFRVLGRLIPDLCAYDRESGNVILKKRLDPEKVYSRLSEISSMTNVEYRRALGFPAMEEPYREKVQEIEEVLKPKKTVKLDEVLWGEE